MLQTLIFRVFLNFYLHYGDICNIIIMIWKNKNILVLNKKNKRGGLALNLPNILSVIRIMMIPFAAYFFAMDNTFVANVIFILACLTDILDGYIARKFNLITDIGKILDPLADKGMQITMLISMGVAEMMPWFVVGFIFLKELMMCLGGALLYKSKIILPANRYGKIATVVTSSCVVSILFFHPVLPVAVLCILQWMPVVFAVYAFIKYLLVFLSYKK